VIAGNGAATVFRYPVKGTVVSVPQEFCTSSTKNVLQVRKIKKERKSHREDAACLKRVLPHELFLLEPILRSGFGKWSLSTIAFNLRSETKAIGLGFHLF
jgi:hypothetical protein